MKTAGMILFILILIGEGQLSGQPRSTPHFVNMGKSKGMRSDDLVCMMQDNLGFIWIGTSSGLNRYDGNHFNIYKKSLLPDQLKHSAILDICQAKDGKIWIAGEMGMYRFSPKDQKFRHYPTAHYKSGAGIDNIISDNNGNIWAGCTSGLFAYKPKADSFVNVELLAGVSGKLTADRIRKNGILSDLGGNGIWIATQKGLNFLDAKTNKIINHVNNQQYPLFNDHSIRALAQSPAGHVWMFDQTAQTIIGFSPHSKQILYQIPLQPEYKTSLGYTLFEDKKGRLWFSSEDNPVMVIKYKETSFFEKVNHDPTDPSSIPSDLFIDGFEDKNGTLYFATNKGLAICNPEREFFTRMPFNEKIPQLLMSHNVCRLYEHPNDNSWWIATHSGEAIRIDPKNFEPIVYSIPEVHAIQGQKNLSLSFQKDGAIFSTAFGAWKFYLPSGKTRKLNDLLPDSFSNYIIKETITEPNGTIWFTNYYSLVKWIPETGRIIVYTPPRSVASQFESFKNIFHLKQSKDGRIWMAKGSGGFAYFDQHADSIYPVPFTLPSSYLSSSYFLEYCFDKGGNPWFALINQGIFTYQKSKGSYHGYDETTGLPHIQYTTAAVDHKGYIWSFRRNEGVIIDTTGKLVLDFEFPSSGDPYKSTTFSAQLSDGRILLNGVGELIVLDQKKISTKPAFANPLISSITKGKSSLPLNGEDKIVCKPLENDIRINFGMLLQQPFYPYTLIYKLEGIDKDWKVAGNDPTAIYQRLPPGKYTFLVKAVGKSADWQSTIASLTIVIQPAYYQTWWFLILCIFIIGTLLYLWYRDKMKQQTGRYEAERKADQLAKEKNLVEYETLKQHLNPHFLFNSLSALSSLIDADPPKAGKFLSGLSRIYRYILQNKDKEVVTIDDELKFIQTFLMLQQTRFGENLQVIIDVPEEIGHKKIVPVTLQNLIENAIKHNIINEEEKLIIHIHAHDNYLLVKNNINLKSHVETSNKQGLKSLQTLYKYITDLPFEYGIDGDVFVVKIPLL